ncbi:hypothetical protein EMGBS4_05890 [Acidimicrobiaceae bacterium]|nr:hypothetical protein EMGBS4_05890 [Acidimicrobiaceae bacterium]
MTGNSATTESDVVSMIDSFVLVESLVLLQLAKTNRAINVETNLLVFLMRATLAIMRIIPNMASGLFMR